jgi:hypothetical protein
MPRHAFDTLAATARLNTESTSHHRERWPSLGWVWDELDELRLLRDEAINAEDHAALETERDALMEAIHAVLNAPEADRDAMLRKALK